MIYLISFIYPQVIKQVSCGAVHVMALSKDGLLQAWGSVQPFSHKIHVFTRNFKDKRTALWFITDLVQTLSISSDRT